MIAEYINGTAPSSPNEVYVDASYVDEPILKDGTFGASTGIVYYHRNQQYSITALTDSSGEVVERYAYDPYGILSIFDASGNIRSSTLYNNSYTYTARRYDATSGLYYFRARYCDPLLGRFISRDPSGYIDGMGLYAAYFSLGGVDPHWKPCSYTWTDDFFELFIGLVRAW